VYFLCFDERFYFLGQIHLCGNILWMLNKNLYTCLLLAAVLLLAKLSFGQCATNPSLYSTLLPVGVNGNVTAGSSVCPSTLATPSISVFSVPAVIIDAGDPASNTFEWAVYGGWITEINGNPTTASQQRTAASTRYSCLSVDGVDVSNNSTITVEWDTTNYSVVHGWVAVRQTSEYGCSDGLWSVYTNDIQNLPPDFNTPIATIILPNPLGVNNYTLPIPLAADQDNCSGVPLSYSFQILDNLGTVRRPTTTVVTPGTDNTLIMPTDTNHVVWTVSDGGRIDTTSYYIIVEPELEILKVALINPNCGKAGTPATNGSAYVTDYTHYNFTTAVQYRYDGGAWGNVPAMGAGSYTIQAGLFYNVDLNGDAVADPADDNDWVLSPVYSFALEETSHNSVDNIPTDAPDVTVVDASCLSSNDGIISISTADAVIGSLNNSVSFNGSSSYLALNKSYSTTSMNAFSVAAWIKTTASSGTILSFNGDSYFGLNVTSGRLQLTTTSNANDKNTVTSSSVVSDGAWHLVTATYDGSKYDLYIDTVLVETKVAVGSPSLGNGFVRYGMIGARSSASTFGQTPDGFYFSGQIADVGIWDNGALTRDNVILMFASGMGSVGPGDRWVLNDVPGAAETVFVDLGNGSNASNWGRFVNCGVVANDAPKLYSWVDIPTLGVATRNNLKAGSSYTFQVRDVYGCGLVDHTYTIGNADSDLPLILWNCAVGKDATQSSLTDASLASDGFFSTPSATSSETNPWWDISLDGNYPVRMVRITANSSFTNAYVIVSSSMIASATLADYLALPGINVKQISLSAGSTGFVTFADNVWGTYVRIWTNETTSLSLGEVEVLTNQLPPDTRHLYLDTECNYTLSSNDATIDLVAFDECGGPTTITNATTGTASITSLSWPVNSYSVVWTATDEVTQSSSLTMNYEVSDSVSPKFVEPPFTGVPTNFTACEALTYQFPIPKVTDNLHDCAPYQYINLYVDGWLAYEYPQSQIDDYTYYTNHLNPGFADAIPSHLKAKETVVHHTLRWEIRDGAGHMIYAEQGIDIEPEPKIREIKVSPIACPGSGNGAVYFSKYDGDATPTSIQFILRNTVSGTEISSGSSPVAAPAGVYQAFININNCPTLDPYPFDVVLNEPADISLVVDTTHVICYGLGDGAIDIEPAGGSETNVLHLWDGGSVGAGDDPAVNIAAEGMIECWMFLDSLASGGTNWDATIFSAGTFGLRMAGGQLEFFATGNSAFPSTTISQRKWYHVAGAIRGGQLELYLNGSVVASQPLVATLPLDGAGIAIGALSGFVRNARIWNAFPASFAENIYMSSPLDVAGNLVANFPINAAGGTSVTNVVNGSYSGSVAGTHSRQQFAYYWTDPDGVFLAFTQDIINVEAGKYTVTLYDPNDCTPFVDEIEVKTADDVAPTMTFYTNHDRSVALGIGEKIIRTTTQTDWGNLADDCIFIPSAEEFNPKVSDGICPVTSAYVTLSYSLVAGSDLFVVDPASTSSLDGSSMTGIMTLLWSAKDLSNPATTMEVTYYIVDNGAPAWYTTFPNAPTVQVQDTTVYVPAGACQYTVQPGECRAYVDDDCNTGILKNNLNGENNLDGYKLDLGTYNVTWTYTDRIFPGQTAPTPITTLRRITVIDNTAPTVTCGSPGSVYLDDLGQASLTVNDLVVSMSDNCSGSTPTLVVTKNMANGMGATYVSQSSTAAGGDAVNAVDNTTDPVFANGSVAMTDLGTGGEAFPWWQVNLGSVQTIYGVQLYASSAQPLSNFWIVFHNEASLSIPADMSVAKPSFVGSVVDTIYVAGAVASSQFFSLAKGRLAQYVTIVKAESQNLAIAEVEVFSAPAPSASIGLECVDVRYVPVADPAVQGSFDPITVLLTALDNTGNASSCPASFPLIDNIAPIVVPQTVSLPLDPITGTVDLNSFVNQINTAATDDACGFDTDEDYLWVTPHIFDCTTVGSQTVSFYARDKYDNPGSQTVVVYITDETAPVIRHLPFPLYINLSPTDGEHIIDPLVDLEGNDPANNQSTDVCGIATRVVSPDRVNCSNRGTFSITYTVTDVNGMSDDSTFNVIVRDVTAPTATYNDYTCVIDESSRGLIRFEDIIPDDNLRDNCDDVSEIRKYISYDNINWCDAGDEGTSVAPAFTNVSDEASKVWGSTQYLSYSVDNVHDIDLSTAYITNDNTGVRSVTYGFPEQYEFNGASVAWHNQSEYSFSRALTYDYDTDGRNTSNALNATYPRSNLDNATPAPYITFTNDNSSQNWGSATCIAYDLGATGYYVTNMVIDWTGNKDLTGDGDTNDNTDCGYPEQIRVAYKGTDNNWYYFTNWTAVSGTSSTVDFNMTIRGVVVLLYRGGNASNRRRIGVNEWTINDRITTEICNVPNTATVQYYRNTAPIGWTNVPGTAGSLTAAAAGTYNTQTFTTVTSDSIRINFNHTTNTRRIGIEEFQVRGRKYWDGVTNTACRYFTCADVGKTVPVYLRWEDKSNNPGSYNTTVEVKPYFSITDVKISDCGVLGEYYSFKTEGTSPFQTYNYKWNTISHPAPVNGDASKPFYLNSTSTAYYTTTNIAPSTNKYIPASGMNEGNYVVDLIINDANTCVDTFRYEFDWTHDDGGLATSIIQRDVCFGEESQFVANIPASYTENYYYWSYNLADVSYVTGGETTNNKLTLKFDKNHTYTEVKYDNKVQDGNQGPGVYCWEKFTYEVTIHDVQKPVLDPIPTNVCPYSTVTYNLSAAQATTFDHLDWVVSNAGTVTAGGNFSDKFVTVYWNNLGVLPTYNIPSIKIRGYNTLGCYDSTTYTFAFEDIIPPVLSNAAGRDADTIHAAESGSCMYIFQSIPLPTMTDNCGIKSYNIKGTAKTNAAGLYGIGETKVVWVAQDYMGNTSNEYTYSIIVQDNEPPTISIPIPVSLNTDATGCSVTYSSDDRKVTAKDNCDNLGQFVTFKLDTIYNNPTGTDWKSVSTLTPNTINGLTFNKGVTRVRYTAADTSTFYNVNAPNPNTSSVEFTVTVLDRTNPTIVDPSVSIANKTQGTDPGIDSATVVITPPSGIALWDNCTPVANLVVTGTRSDGLALTKKYPVGVTTITWVVRDEANNPLPSNPLSYTQTITVGDYEAPIFTDMTEFTAKTISYCSRIAYPIAIPVSKKDNVGVVQLDYRILDGSGTLVPGGSGSIKKNVYPNFKPNGTNFLDGFTFPAVDAVLGSDFTVIWTAIDAAGNKSDDITYRYTIHVEMEPNFTEWTTNVDCNGATITVTEYPDNSQPARFRYDRDHGYDAYYNIGTGWTTNTSFSVPGTGTYTLRMQVNGCEAPSPISIPVSEAEPYRLSTEKTDVDCPELKTGMVDLTMTGGVTQLLLNGSGYTSTYDQLNLGAEGAVEAWVYLNSLADVNILSRSTYGLGLSTAVVDGKTVGYFTLGVGSDVLTSTFVVAAHRWYHVSGSWNGSTMTITIDGTETDSQASSQSATGVNGTAFVIGAGFSGMLREVSVWNAIPAGFGAIHNAGNKIQGNETGLVGFWDLGGGSGTEAKNRSGSYYAWAKDATGADTWAANKVQPGYYTWIKATAITSGTYSTAGKSNINLTELDTATYTVSFVDPYGCAAANTSFEKIVAIDNELPAIDLSALSAVPLLTEANSCTYTFTDLAVVNNYVPAISDKTNLLTSARSCNYHIKWQLVTDHNLHSWVYNNDDYLTSNPTAVLNKILNSVLGRKALNGKNTVYVTVSQNGMVLDPPVQYDITLNDKVFPVAFGKTSTPSMNLDASGVVVYTALQHNDPVKTSDNCSEDADMLYEISPDNVVWGPSLSFNCNDIGKDVNVWFRVTDEAGNATTVQTAITDLVVKDVTPPETHETSYQPLGPYCATGDADVVNGIPAYADIPLSALVINRYTDNCGVYRISYKRDYQPVTYSGGDDAAWQLVDERNDLSEPLVFPATLVRFFEGKTTVYFQLTDGDPDVVTLETEKNSTEQPIFVVTVLPKPKPGDGAGGGIN
jgi:hypothetical protein